MLNCKAHLRRATWTGFFCEHRETFELIKGAIDDLDADLATDELKLFSLA